MSSQAILQVRRIVQAKWNKTGEQEELTAEAERVLKKAQSKSSHFIFLSIDNEVKLIRILLTEAAATDSSHLQRPAWQDRPPSMSTR